VRLAALARDFGGQETPKFAGDADLASADNRAPDSIEPEVGDRTGWPADQVLR
jgi:hypothetical protein